ncbi:MAG: hypothetical protein ABJA98_30820 [Acidobacteriota bacterium]
MFRTLLKTDALAINDRTLAVRYFESLTRRGDRRYSAEIVLAPRDRIILDGDTMAIVEEQATRLGPALYSRMLIARSRSASTERPRPSMQAVRVFPVTQRNVA